MKSLLQPTSVALIGASDRAKSIGRQILSNLLGNGFKGKVYPINRNYKYLQGVKCYPSLYEVEGEVDLAILAVPSRKHPYLLEECGRKGVKAVIIIAAGFREMGMEGVGLEHEILQTAKKWGIRILGTHSIGLALPYLGLNASFLEGKVQEGNIAFISQSGALCNAILDWSRKENIGFSAFVSLGTMIDVDWGDLLTYVGEDHRTKAVLMYVESIGDARKFISAAREVAFSKPIIAMKAGDSAEVSQMAMFHTGSLGTDSSVIDAAFRRCGILRVERIAELFFMASVLSKQAASKGKRLAILSNAAGPAILAADILVKGKGELAGISEETIAKIKEHPLANSWNIFNPLDIQYQAFPEDFEKLTELLIRDSGNDAVMVIVTPQLHCPAEEVAERLAKFSKKISKPLIVSIVGGINFDNASKILNDAGIPALLFPDGAVRVFNYIWRYSYNIKGLYETPRPPEILLKNRPERQEIHARLGEIQASGRTMLSEWEAGIILKAYGLPVVQTELATSAQEACNLAEQIGLPVVLKLHTHATHQKREAGGVKLHINSKEHVKSAFEEIRQNAILNLGEASFLGVLVQKMHEYTGLDIYIGSEVDSLFGPIIYFGNGGRIVELYNDKVVGFPPLNTTLAHRMMEQTHIYHAAKAVYQVQPAIIDKMEQFLVRFSHLIAEQPLISTIQVNPLAVSRFHEHSLLILDAQIDLHEPDSTEKDTKLAIRPYPYEYEEVWKLRDGEQVSVRPIRPDDEPLVVEFHKKLSDESVYLRYFYSASFDFRVSHERLARICFVDYDREMATVVLSQQKVPELLAAGRIIRLSHSNKAEFALSIRDDYQGKGLGSKIMKYLITIAKKEGIGELVADILNENSGMKRVCQKFGFSLKYNREEGVVKASLPLHDFEI